MRALSATKAPGTGLVYRLDVRIKMLISLLISLVSVFLNTHQGLGLLLVASFLYVVSLNRNRLLLVCYLVIGLMWCLALGCVWGMNLLLPSFPSASWDRMLIPFMRSTVVLNTVLALAFSSRINTILTALKSLRLPIWIYLPSAVMIRFVPAFVSDVQQIYSTLKIRGHRLTPLFFIRKPILASRLLIAPIVFRVLRSSDDLGLAAELKGIGKSKKVTHYNVPTLTRNDFTAAALCTLICAAAVVLQVKEAATAVGSMI